MHWLDFIGALLSLICTYYFTQAQRLAWIIGIFAVIFNCTLYWQKGIYGYGFLLECIFFVTMVIGWFRWSSKNKTDNSERPIQLLTLSQGIRYSAIAVIAVFMMAQGLQTWTDTTIPYLDSSITVASLIAQWLLSLKIIQCWILWFIVDLATAVLHFHNDLPFHGALYCLYLGMAVLGYFRWQKLYYRTFQHA